jgi:hypothetical protein
VKKFAVLLLASLTFAGLAPTISGAQAVRTETMEHPRIAAAIRQMEDAILYLQAAPHDFGGHREAAIRDTRAAIAELRASMAFRARMDRR